MYKSDNQSVEAFFDYLSVNPAVMVLICIAVPFVGLMIYSVFRTEPKVEKPQPRHLRNKNSIPVRAYRIPKASQDDVDFDFEKITFWYNEIGNETKELV